MAPAFCPNGPDVALPRQSVSSPTALNLEVDRFYLLPPPLQCTHAMYIPVRTVLYDTLYLFPVEVLSFPASLTKICLARYLTQSPLLHVGDKQTEKQPINMPPNTISGFVYWPR